MMVEVVQTGNEGWLKLSAASSEGCGDASLQ